MKINDKVFLLNSTKGAYVYLILGKEIILIDTGLQFHRRGILKELAAMNIQLGDIKHILLTHNDLDHIGNAAKLQEETGAKLWASAQDIPYITGCMHRPSFKKFLPYIFRVKKPKDVIAYKDGEKVGGVEIIPTPGHTPGHVCLLFEDVLFAGDLVKNVKGDLIPYPSFWNWDSLLLEASINKISGFSYKWVCPAHGEPIERNKITKLED
jgi:glyoxylase-like metal-dependent hydrolase (beta-lactamase superfamily II)